MESEDGIPEWLGRKLDEMCPGFLAGEKKKVGRDSGQAPVRLGEWIERQVFAFAERGGWLRAVTFYAVREPRYQRASACWTQSVEKWRRAKPQRYPSLEQWCREAALCDESAHLLPEVRRQHECFKLVDSSNLAEALARYIDWEALAYWARPALEREPIVDVVARELDMRCPGFREVNSRERAQDSELPKDWQRLMLWIRDHFFHEAKMEGWYDAVVICADIHPRAIRTMEFADHCDDCWRDGLPAPYPSFESWRTDADRYLDAP